MKWHSYRGFLLLLATATSALPSSGPNHNGNGPYQAAFRAPVVSEDPFLQWELPPDPNSTHHLIFYSVSGFLQRWPNTFRRNGALGSFYDPQIEPMADEQFRVHARH
jgi:hypothetical protein